MTRRRAGFTMIELLAVVVLIAVLISLLLPGVQSAREAARRAQCANNLMQIGIAVRNYESSHRVLPPGSVDSVGPVVEVPTAYQFSWIAQVLPYMERKNIYRSLDFRVGAYQPANITASSVTISVLTCPSGRGFRNSAPRIGISTGSLLPEFAPTDYAACHHDVESPIDVTNRGVFYLNSRVRYDEIEDGLAHTIFFGEKLGPGSELGWVSGTRASLRNTGTPINRTALDPLDLSTILETPEAAPPGPAEATEKPEPTPPRATPAPRTVGGFGSNHAGGANFAFGDGSVRFLRSVIDTRVYQLLGNRADGQPIGDDQF